MSKISFPSTPAVHFLRELGVPEHAVVKTLVMETDAKRPVIILMHGDRQVSAQALARAIDG
jgi:prolyl-tRNA editing enzyme YbaK/EbsC (Cys-tRNA(Pro) deacylase)